MSQLSQASDPSVGDEPEVEPVSHLAQLWAKKYVLRLDAKDDTPNAKNLVQQTAEKLENSLRTASVHAWSQTEKMISHEVQRHDIDNRLIDPWQISQDSFVIYNKAIAIYKQEVPPEYLARVVGSYIGQIRTHYTSVDPRVVGFVSMQIHHTGQALLKQISPLQRQKVNSYFKVIDDFLYMPLQRAYTAAGNYDYESPVLQVVQKLLPMSSDIAKKICERVIDLYPYYYTYSGSLKDTTVKIASIRDTEMFQVYLWVCVLEKNISSIQQELFPLCVMLYPTLKVQWELVRQMIHLLGKEISSRLGEKEKKLFQPYFQVLWEMFSPEVFPESLN
jgi:Phycobilisome protein